MEKKSGKRKIISIGIWIFFLMFNIISKYPLNQIIYFQLELLVIIMCVNEYIASLKKYRSIPIKTVQAKFIKTYRGVEYYRTDSNGEKEYTDINIHLYEYNINGKKGKYKLKNNTYTKDDIITLYYRKGKVDITSREIDLNTFSMWDRVWRTIMIIPGSVIIVYIILFYIFKIPVPTVN